MFVVAARWSRRQILVVLQAACTGARANTAAGHVTAVAMQVLYGSVLPPGLWPWHGDGMLI